MQSASASHGVPLANAEGFIARRLAADETIGDWTLGLSFDGSGLPVLDAVASGGGSASSSL